jgi:uncharacterized protein (TIGR02145 family)
MGWFNKKENTDLSPKSNKVTRDALTEREERTEERQRKLSADLGQNKQPSASLMALFRNGNFTDERDGQKYRTVKIGDQVWMAENLKYGACDLERYKWLTVGGTWGTGCYNLDTAREICPSGWHLPTLQEWNVLIEFVGGVGVAGEKLKATRGWESGCPLPGYYNGTDDYGFSALPGYYIYINPEPDLSRIRLDPHYYDNWSKYGGGALESGYWWTATGIKDTNMAYGIRIDRGKDYVCGIHKFSRDSGLEVRCVQD